MDNTIRFWDRERFLAEDTTSFLERQSTCRISGAVYASPESVCIAHDNGEIVEWDITSGEVVRQLTVDSSHANRFNIAVSPCDQSLAILSGRWPVGGIAHVEVHARHEEGYSCRWHVELPDGASITPPKFSPDGQLLAVPSLKRVQLFAADDGELLRNFRLPWVFCVSFSDDGRLFAASRGNITHIFRTTDWTSQCTIQTSKDGTATRGLDFFQDGKTLAASDEHHVSLWDVGSGRLLRRSEPLSDLITVLDISPNDQRIAAFTKDGAIHLMHSETLDPQLTLPFPAGWTFHGSFSPDGNRIVVGAGHACRVFEADGIERLEKLNLKELQGSLYRQINARPSRADVERFRR